MLVLEKSSGNKDSALIRATETAPCQGHSPYSGIGCGTFILEATAAYAMKPAKHRELANSEKPFEKEKKRAGEAPALLRFPGYGWDYSATVQ